MYRNLLRGSRNLRLGLRNPTTRGKGLAVILVHGVGLFLALSLRGVNPVDANILLAIGKILSVPLVCIFGRELLQIINAEFLVSSTELSRTSFATLENLIDVIQFAHGTLGLED